ncbi:carboxymuconolactone decarboxylase family protein [Thalassococcus sp. CAU 1522]|uniref:Carboxymuconolactone decarboxylase family protein n=1 Tax=Thalassococcus arenae TaxID=2851652 RepID=A0ABS6NC47_9RHOB|nr:carboxymuconolactone decarboxylase family protein [Thalassococcus arenae]MBV2361604.1 carboxymuconolactone decarboxylase family protein [Thalassococcus arenae]
MSSDGANPSAASAPPLSDADWPRDLADMRNGFAGGLNVYRTMAHHPALLRAWSGLREHIVNQSALGREFLEVVILRTGTRLGSDYEWAQHILRARACGLSDARITSIGGPLGAMQEADATLCRAVDELFATARLSPGTLAAVSKDHGREAVFDLMATVGFYSTLGYILNSFDTPLDTDVEAALTEKPLAP